MNNKDEQITELEKKNQKLVDAIKMAIDHLENIHSCADEEWAKGTHAEGIIGNILPFREDDNVLDELLKVIAPHTDSAGIDVRK